MGDRASRDNAETACRDNRNTDRKQGWGLKNDRISRCRRDRRTEHGERHGLDGVGPRRGRSGLFPEQLGKHGALSGIGDPQKRSLTAVIGIRLSNTEFIPRLLYVMFACPGIGLIQPKVVAFNL